MPNPQKLIRKDVKKGFHKKVTVKSFLHSRSRLSLTHHQSKAHGDYTEGWWAAQWLSTCLACPGPQLIPSTKGNKQNPKQPPTKEQKGPPQIGNKCYCQAYRETGQTHTLSGLKLNRKNSHRGQFSNICHIFRSMSLTHSLLWEFIIQMCLYMWKDS